MRRVPWIGLAALTSSIGIWLASRWQPMSGLLPGCAFKRFTGLACATCGLTRCLLALGHGDWRAAFHWHPAAALFAALLPLLAIWDLRRAWRDDPYPVLPDSRLARVSVWIMLLGIWVWQAARGI